MGDFEIAFPPSPVGSDPAHTHAHEATTGKGTDDHHAKSHAHSGADGSGTVAHSATTGQGVNDHHAQAHTVTGADHTASGLTTGHVLRASAATAFTFAQLAHGDLGTVTADQHHAKSHIHDGADGSGTVAHSATTGQTANDHHAQSHTDSDHSDGANIKKALVTTKGDLIAASASATPARVAAGTNGLALVADSAQTAGVKYGGGVRRWAVPYYGGIANTSQVGTTGRVYLVQFEIPFGATADAIAYVVGTASSGNLTVGIYGPLASATADTCAGATVLVQSSSTAQSAGLSANQVVTFTATPLPAGIYYAAFELDNTTGTYCRLGNLTSPQSPGIAQYYDRGGGYGTLTGTCPAVTENGSNVPGLRVRLSA